MGMREEKKAEKSVGLLTARGAEAKFSLSAQVAGVSESCSRILQSPWWETPSLQVLTGNEVGESLCSSFQASSPLWVEPSKSFSHFVTSPAASPEMAQRGLGSQGNPTPGAPWRQPRKPAMKPATARDTDRNCAVRRSRKQPRVCSGSFSP